MILERAILDPRHIEIQVFGDRHGNAIHLGERDCSVQRRHQKLIEEAPSPAVTPALRTRMGAVAVNAIKSIGYEGAGTLEFLLDQNGEFYFMEMNTRLQVEHPVTEAITGLDLVELQLRVAGGEPLGLTQQDITFSGHAIEVRLCSEDAAHDFMPQSGKMALWQMPDGLRVEHALQSGTVIPPFYDSMIAKTHQPWRHPRRGAAQAHSWPRTDRRVRRHHQSGVSRRLPARIPPSRRARRRRRSSADIAMTCWRRGGTWRPTRRSRRCCCMSPTPMHRDGGAGARWRRLFQFRCASRFDHRMHELEIARERDGGYVASLDGGEHRFEIDELGGDSIRFRTQRPDGIGEILPRGDRLYILHRGITLAVRDLTLSAPAAAAATGSDGKVRAAMNGRVVAVLVKPGERVAAGQPVMTLEAMKMEHVHAAPIAGIISAIDVAEGEQVTTGKVVVEIDAG